MEPIVGWVILGALFLALELFTPGTFFVLFGIAAFITAAGAWLGIEALGTQLIVFILLSIVLLVFMRPMVNAVTRDTGERFGVDALVGKDGMVVEDVDPDAERGMVRVGGEEWRARAGSRLEKGTKVRVDRVEGNIVHVKRLEKEA